MPKKKKIGSGIVVPKTVLEKAKTVHSTRARKLEELISIMDKIKDEKDPAVQNELRIKRRKLNDSLNLKPQKTNLKPKQARSVASAPVSAAASSSGIAPSLGPRRRASAPVASMVPLSSPASSSAQRLRHVLDGVLSVDNGKKEKHTVRLIGCAAMGLHFMVEEKFEKYFGYLARCEGKFCTTALKI